MSDEVSIPNASAHRSNPGAQMDSRIAQHARDVRVENQLVTAAAFKRNVAVAMVEIDGTTEFLKDVNTPTKDDKANWHLVGVQQDHSYIH